MALTVLLYYSSKSIPNLIGENKMVETFGISYKRNIECEMMCDMN